MHKTYLLLFCLLVILLSSCSQTPESTPTLTSLPPASGYPVPYDPSQDTTYPGPAFLTPVSPDTPNLSDTLDIPKPSVDSAIIYGQLSAKDGAGRAYLAGDVYLAPVIYSEGEMQIPFVSLDVDNDPKASQRTKDQQFLFVDVPPGVYGIVIHTPVSDYVVLDDVEGFRYVDINAGDVIDLGVILIE
jgi:hypothetical protein